MVRNVNSKAKAKLSYPQCVKMEDYITKIRKAIGHDPMLLPHAVVVVFDDEGKVLIEERADDGYLDFPGGTVDVGEEVIETAKRELFEETGLVPDELTLFNIYSGEITKYQYFNGDIIYGVDVVYICKKYHGELKPQLSEVKTLQFMRLEDIKGKLSPRNIQIIKELKQL